MDLRSTLLDWLTSFPKSTFVFWLLITVCLGIGVTNLTVTPDNRIFYSSSNERFTDLLEFETKYLPNNNILFVIYDPSSAIIANTHAIRWVEEHAWLIDNTLRVDSISNYPIVEPSDDSSANIVPLLDSLCAQETECELQRGWSKDFPELKGRFVSEDESAVATILTIDVELGTHNEISDISEQARTLLADFRQEFPSLKIAHSGGVPMMQAFADASEKDTALLLPVAFVLIFLATSYMLRSITIALILSMVGLCSAISTMGLAGHLGMTINTATSLTAVIVFTVVIASAMHMLVSYLNELQIYDSYQAARNSLLVNLRPISLATLTSALGFLSLALADAPPLGELGMLVSFGLIVGALISISLVPSLLAAMKIGSHPGVRTLTISRILAGESSNKLNAGTLAVFLAVSLTGLSLLSINDDFVSYFDDRYQFRVETDLIETLISSPNHIELDVEATGSDTIFSPAYVSALAAFQLDIEEDPLVANAYGYSNILERARNLSETRKGSESPEELAQLFLIYEMSLGFGQSTADFVSSDNRSSRVSVLLKRSDSEQINRLKQNIESIVVNEHPNLDVIVTGENVPVANLSAQNLQSMLLGIAASIAIIAILLTLVYRSLLIGCIAFLAVTLPILTTFGLWGWTFGDIGLASVVFISAALGIVIDDAIHFISRYQSFMQDSTRSAHQSVQLAVRVVGSAIVATSIALICGFGAICLSGFEINFAMGACMVTVVGVSVLVDLVGIPFVLRHFSSPN